MACEHFLIRADVIFKMHYFYNVTVILMGAILLVVFITHLHNNTIGQNFVISRLGLGYNITCYG